MKQEIGSSQNDKKPHIVDLKQDVATCELVPDIVNSVSPECQGTGPLVVRLDNKLGPLVRATKKDLEKQFKDAQVCIPLQVYL